MSNPVLKVKDEKGNIIPVKMVQGYSPKKGVDYYTQEEVAAVEAEVVERLFTVTKAGGESE